MRQRRRRHRRRGGSSGARAQVDGKLPARGHAAAGPAPKHAAGVASGGELPVREPPANGPWTARRAGRTGACHRRGERRRGSTRRPWRVVELAGGTSSEARRPQSQASRQDPGEEASNPEPAPQRRRSGNLAPAASSPLRCLLVAGRTTLLTLLPSPACPCGKSLFPTVFPRSRRKRAGAASRCMLQIFGDSWDGLRLCVTFFSFLDEHHL